MEIIEGSIVRSIAGRDKGDLFIVLSREGDFVYLANGCYCTRTGCNS